METMQDFPAYFTLIIKYYKYVENDQFLTHAFADD